MRNAANPLSKNLNFRLSESDYEKIRRVSESFGGNVTSFCRMACLMYADMFDSILPKLKEMSIEQLADLAQQAQKKIG